MVAAIEETFDGLTSRWTSPDSCAASSADASCSQISTARRASSFSWAASSFFRSPPVGESHGEIQLPVDLACVMDGDDVRVLERGSALRLAQEALTEALVGSSVFGSEQLQGDVAL